MDKKLYQAIAGRIQARENCIRSLNASWERSHKDAADAMARNALPSGSGFYMGTKIDWEKSNSERIVFSVSFHHTDVYRGYDGWTDHSVIVTASLTSDFNIRVTGRDRNDIKEYITETFLHALDVDGRETLDGWKETRDAVPPVEKLEVK